MKFSSFNFVIFTILVLVSCCQLQAQKVDLRFEPKENDKFLIQYVLDQESHFFNEGQKQPIIVKVKQLYEMSCVVTGVPSGEEYTAEVTINRVAGQSAGGGDGYEFDSKKSLTPSDITSMIYIEMIGKPLSITLQ